MNRIFALLFFITATAGIALGQKLTSAVSKNRVAVGEAFQIQFTLNGNGSIKLPNMNDFEVYQGPYQSSSTSIINGSISQSTSVTYVIAARKEGRFTIGPASASISGNTVQSNPITIEVVKGSSGNQAQGNPNPNNNQGVTAPSSNNNDNVIVKAVVNKSKAYIGEEISITYKLYFRVDILQLNITTMPSFEGFFLQESKAGSGQTNETIDGVTYAVTEIKRTFAIPQRTGKLTIDPFEIECTVRQRSNRKPRDIFEQMMGTGYENVVVKAKSKPVTIEALPLPEEGKPAGFSGAVGDYTYKVELSKDKVKANEAVNLMITLAGKGNIKLIDPPKVAFPEDFEIYDPKLKENISVGAAGISGSRTFDYLVIPRHEGDYKITDLDFTFFNPSKKEYVTIPSPELNIHVDKGDASNTSASVYSPANKEEVKSLGNDIRYIKTGEPRLHRKDEYFFGSPLFYTGLILPILAFTGLLLYRRKKIEENKDIVAVRSRKATKMAKKRLSAAEQHLQSNNKEIFYSEVSHALYGYVSNKLNIAGADLNREHITASLRNRNVSEINIQQLLSTLDTCEYARYAPSAVSGDLRNIYNSTVELITKIEDEIK
ncbi:MAG TPA: BatD family protein [Bacteroidia bacterium]|jgi:hypothetical protein